MHSDGPFQQGWLLLVCVCFPELQTLLDTLRLALGKTLVGSDSEERSSVGKVEGPD